MIEQFGRNNAVRFFLYYEQLFLPGYIISCSSEINSNFFLSLFPSISSLLFSNIFSFLFHLFKLNVFSPLFSITFNNSKSPVGICLKIYFAHAQLERREEEAGSVYETIIPKYIFSKLICQLNFFFAPGNQSTP